PGGRAGCALRARARSPRSALDCGSGQCRRPCRRSGAGGHLAGYAASLVRRSLGRTSSAVYCSSRPGWRNWQTQWTQNPPDRKILAGSTPAPGTIPPKKPAATLILPLALQAAYGASCTALGDEGTSAEISVATGARYRDATADEAI